MEILNRDFRKVLKSYNAENVFVYADCQYLGTEDYYENVFSMQDHKDLAEMLKSHKGKFALSSKAKKDLRKLYRSNNHYVLNFEADDVKLYDLTKVKLKTVGNTQVVKFTAGNNQSCPVCNHHMSMT